MAKEELLESGVAHFSITGEALVDIARDMMLSDMPARAWRLLSQNLLSDEPADTSKLAIDVLEGRMTLAGDSNVGVTPEPEDPKKVERYLHDVKFIYAGRVRLGTSWWRPWGVVTSFGPDDAQWALTAAGLSSVPTQVGPVDALRAWSMGRVAYYGPRGSIVLEARDTYVIFEACGEPPFWWHENHSVDVAMAQCREVGRKLRETGFADHVQDKKPFKPQVKSGPTKEELAEREAEDARQEAAYQAKLREYQQRIVEQAGDNLFDLHWVDKEGKSQFARVPTAPFERWALSRDEHLRDMRPAWTNICPSGLKMPLDDVDHSDWMIGAGLFDFRDFYDFDGGLHKAAYRMHSQVQSRYRNTFRQCSVLNSGPVKEGWVAHPKRGEKSIGAIVVLPNLHPDYIDAVVNASAVITQAGGAAAHLAQIALDNRVPLVLVPEAIKKFPAGCRVRVDTEAAEVRRLSLGEDDE